MAKQNLLLAMLPLKEGPKTEERKLKFFNFSVIAVLFGKFLRTTVVL
jgi:hypothetical protein